MHLEEITGMTMRTTEKTITLHRPFCLKGVDRCLAQERDAGVMLSRPLL